jgi:predicted Zn-dependent protease
MTSDGRPTRSRHGTFAAIALVLIAVLSAGCAVNPATGERDFVLMSEEQEIALGRQYHPQVLTQYRVYEDPDLQAYVQSIGETLAANSHRDNLIYRFNVLDSDEVNAFALPGGYIYITRGLMAYLNSEAELAAVLGHEIGHVTARHSVQQHAQASLVGVAGAAVAVGTGSRAAYDLTSVLGTALVRGYGRDDELQADRLGAEYLARSGYRPDAMIDVVEVLKDQEEFEIARARAENREPKVYHGVFSTHPANDERLQEAVRAGEAYAADTAPAAGQDAAWLSHLEGMPFGSSREEGILKGRDFYHADLAFTLRFPEGWRVENLPDRIVAIAPGDEAVLQVTTEDLNRKGTPREFFQQRLGVKNARDGADLELDGLAGHTAIAPAADSPFGRRPVRFGVIFHGNRAFIVAGAAETDRGMSAADPEILDTIRSFRALGPGQLDRAEPLVIHVVEAGTDTRIEALAADSPLPGDAEQRLRLLNGLYPDGEPGAGELVKVVR